MPDTSRAQESIFSELKQKFDEGQVFKADFVHQSVDSYTQDTTSDEGWIWVGQRRYKVRTDRQSVVVNGKTSMVYDNSRNRVIISKYAPEEDDFAPSRILNGIDSTFTVDVQEWRDDHYYIKLSSEDPFAVYKKVEIFLSKDKIPRKIRAVDPVDNIITTKFSNGSFIAARNEMFQLDYPDGAEIIDMRNE
ncbi:MAG TPA: outer membrane lipoprotein carrier protein LolA [Fodinibius sp.]|nr:outer membrane lipoprotein carrier protein LolA [Fodinibius sp.]